MNLEQPWIFLVTHGQFGKELIKSAEMIIGKIKHIYCYGLEDEMSPEMLFASIATEIEKAPLNSIILTDIYGGTPSNVSAIFAKKNKMLVISGVNLAMLIQADMLRSEGGDSEIAKELIQTGYDSIKNITDMINERST